MKYSQLIVSFSLGLLVEAQQYAWGQCAGIYWTGPTDCISGQYCKYTNDYYSQCVPGSAPTTLVTSSKPTSTSASSGPVASSLNPGSGAKAWLGGVNMAGFDFGVSTDGYQDFTQIQTPDNAQFAHFVNDDKLNVFRLPFGWQFLLNNVLGGTLDPTNFARYDSLVQACLATGSYCIIDLHNYARWNGGIVGQGGPTDAQMADVWTQLANKYKSQTKIIFGIMNEPHDLPSIATWATTVQASVNAIRFAGATSQMILLPGTGYTSAGTFISSGSLSALSAVSNHDGSKTNLIFDVHIYQDSDYTGTHPECVTNNIDNAFAPLATALRAAGRKAMLTETGGGNTASCVQYVCEQLTFVDANGDVYIGYTGWSAGGFQLSWNYVLSLVPSLSNGVWTDTLLMKSCFSRA